MKNQFSKIEFQRVMNKFLETTPKESLIMYQDRKRPECLIVETIASSVYELKKLEALNLSITIYAENYHVKLHLLKR